MRTTSLGPDGPEVGVIGLGCMGMSFSYDQATPRDEAPLISVILPQSRLRSTGGPPSSLDLGMTLLDTSDVYGPFTNEELLGRALKSRRDQAVLATKVGALTRDTRGNPVMGLNNRPEHCRCGHGTG